MKRNGRMKQQQHKDLMRGMSEKTILLLDKQTLQLKGLKKPEKNSNEKTTDGNNFSHKIDSVAQRADLYRLQQSQRQAQKSMQQLRLKA
jgi:hypothetical protein